MLRGDQLVFLCLGVCLIFAALVINLKFADLLRSWIVPNVSTLMRPTRFFFSDVSSHMPLRSYLPQMLSSRYFLPDAFLQMSPATCLLPDESAEVSHPPHASCTFPSSSSTSSQMSSRTQAPRSRCLLVDVSRHTTKIVVCFVMVSHAVS